MARTPDPRLHALWRQRLARQADSGLTIARFCRQEGILTSNFHAWKRRLQLGEAVPTRLARPDSTAPAAFLPVTVTLPRPLGQGAVPIEAELPNGVRLRITAADPRLARRIIHALAAARTNPGGSR